MLLRGVDGPYAGRVITTTDHRGMAPALVDCTMPIPFAELLQSGPNDPVLAVGRYQLVLVEDVEIGPRRLAYAFVGRVQ